MPRKKTPKRGRPKLKDPNRIDRTVKLNRATLAAADRYAINHGLPGASTAIRVAAEVQFKAEGLL